ncbi:hypothetical protein BJX99DRAFT_257030 [Aspergillus californicus]
MDLPPEIRNQIYSYLFLPQRVHVVRLKNPENHAYRLYHVQLPPRDPENQTLTCLPHYCHDENSAAELSSKAKGQTGKNPTKKSKKRWQTQLSIPMVSKQAYGDTICLVYANTQFVFESLKPLSRFLSTTPKQAQAVITHLELGHIMYNEPSLTKFRDIKLRSDRNLYMLCESVANAFDDLSVLHVNLGVYDAPIQLRVGEGWSLPILAFGRRKRQRGEKGLMFARVRLTCFQFPVDKVRRVEREVEKQLMDPIYLQLREDEMMAREMSGPMKAMKVLRVVFN